MRHFQFITAIILSSFTILSCTKEIEFNVKLIDPKLVVNSICPLDSTFVVEVSESKAIPGYESSYRMITDATVKLFVDGIEIEKLVFDSTYQLSQGTSYITQSAYYTGNTLVESGKNYKIEVSHPDYQTKATGEMKIGKRVPILGVSTDSIPYIDKLSRKQQKIKVTMKFSDPVDEVNFYRLVLNYRIGNNEWYKNEKGDSIKLVQVMDYVYAYSNIESDDPVFSSQEDADEMLFGSTNYSGMTLFPDELFNGKTYDLNFYMNKNVLYRFQEEGMDATRGDFYIVTIELQSLTRDSYFYIKSLGSFDWLSDGLLTEPVLIYSNIENGIGIFGGCTSSISTIQKGNYPVEGVKYNFGTASY